MRSYRFHIEMIITAFNRRLVPVSHFSALRVPPRCWGGSLHNHEKNVTTRKALILYLWQAYLVEYGDFQLRKVHLNFHHNLHDLYKFSFTGLLYRKNDYVLAFIECGDVSTDTSHSLHLFSSLVRLFIGMVVLRLWCYIGSIWGTYTFHLYRRSGN